MNRILNRKELINIISALLNNKRIVVGGNKETYKRKYHLKYNKKIIDTIITAFCDAIVISLENGDSVRINNYFKIEPYYRKEAIMKANRFNGMNTNVVPAHYLPKFRAGIKLKEACNKLTEDMRE